jgi:predicted NAD/FAD-binding protein
MLDDPSEQERQILGAIPYQRNTVILHTDISVLPRNRRAWASWNYHILDREQHSVAITYNMDILQRLGSEQIYCVTLNVPDAIDPGKIIREFSYDHPVFNAEGVAAQRRRDEINGVRNTFFAGAYWGYGFHEDGMNSALEVCRHFGIEL